MPHPLLTLPNDRRARRPLQGQGHLPFFREHEQVTMAPAVTARVPVTMGPLAEMPGPMRRGAPGPLTLSADAAAREQRLPFGRAEAPAWSSVELPDGAQVTSAASVDAVPLTSAVIDAFAGDSLRHIDEAAAATDRAALAAAFARVKADGLAYYDVFIVALWEALLRLDGPDAEPLRALVRKRMSAAWEPLRMDPPGRRADGRVPATVGRVLVPWARETRDFVRFGMEGAREVVRVLGEGGLVLLLPRPVNLTLAGHPVQVEGMEGMRSAGGLSAERRERGAIAVLDEALRRLRVRSERVAPGFMHRMPPIVVTPEACGDMVGSSPDAVAAYDQHRAPPAILVCTESLAEATPDQMVRALAHETGHHLWRTHLSGDARREWEWTVQRDEVPVDLKLLLKHWPVGATWADAIDSLRATRPELATILRGEFVFGPLSRLRDRDRLAEAVRLREKDWVSRGRSITVYAHKDPEEAFCEALALAVSHGPAVLHDDVAQWLRVTMPSLRTHANGRRPPPPPAHGSLVDPLRPLTAPVRTEVVLAAPNAPEELQHEELWIVASKSGRERPWRLIAAVHGEITARRVAQGFIENDAHIAVVPPRDVGVKAVRHSAGVDKQGRPPTYVPHDPRPVEEWDEGRRIR